MLVGFFHRAVCASLCVCCRYFAARLAADVRVGCRRLLTKFGERVLDLQMEVVR